MHISQAQIIVNGLYQIHFEDQYADQVVAKQLKSSRKLGSKDRKLIANTIYVITRYWRKYAFVADEFVGKEKVWNALAAYCFEQEITIPDWREITITKDIIKQKLEEANKQFAIRESIPDWLDNLGRESFEHSFWDQEIIAQNQVADVVLRVQSTAIPKQHRPKSRLFAQQELLKENIQTEIIEHLPEALKLLVRKNIKNTKAYQKGFIEIQDVSSQKLGLFTNVKPGMKIIDACAGAGGKSLHLANLMKNNGQIIATDIIEWKLKELEKRARRAKITCITTQLVSEIFVEKNKQSADIVLVDAPCSGLGTLRRKPDLKNKLSLNFFHEMIDLQAKLLESYSQLVKPSGHLVYATCSILPQENQQQVEQFLANNNSFHLEEEKQLFNSTAGSDGFYMAKLQPKVS